MTKQDVGECQYCGGIFSSVEDHEKGCGKNSEKDIKIALNAEDFRCLVRGGELTIEDASCRVHLILNDVGHLVVSQAVDDAFIGRKDLYVSRTRSNDWRPWDKKVKP